MLPISVSDIVKLLEQVPIWKSVVGLPKRLAELEARVAALEGRTKVPNGPTCALCGAPMKVTKVVDDPVFGEMGLKQHHLACTSCGHSETRQVDPTR
jgi:hypothetical protein